jgi:replicative DNA helicase
MPTFDRVPPHDLAAEAGVIGSIILDPGIFDSVLRFVKSPDAFSRDENRIVFSVLLELHSSNIPIDGLILRSTLSTKGLLEKAGGMSHIVELANSVPTSAHAEYYAAIVDDKFRLRQVLSVCAASANEVYACSGPASEVVDRFEQRAFALADKHVSNEATAVCDVVHEVAADIFNPKSHNTIKTGLIELDHLTAGLSPGDMIVLAARPSHGKTALGLNIAENIAIDMQRPVGFFSLEMSKKQLALRSLCSRSGVDSHKLRTGRATPDDLRRITEACGEVSNAKLHIDDSPGISAMEFRAKARRMVRNDGVRLIILDYLQLMTGEGSHRQEEVSAISRAVKATARELEIPIIALSQLNRSNESENRLPRTSDLRESGAIEQDADMVWLLHREAVARRGDAEWFEKNQDKANTALLIVAKQRNGPCETITLTYLSSCTRFVNYNPGV